MVVELDPWFESPDMSKTTFDAVVIRPADYAMAAHILDVLYINYLSDRFEPFTYGTSWVLSTNDGLGGIVAIDPRWVQDGKGVVPDAAVSRRMTEPPDRYNLSPRETFGVQTGSLDAPKIVAATDPWITQVLIRNPKGHRGLLHTVLAVVPAKDLDLSRYPFVAVVNRPFLLPGEFDPTLALVQQKDCTADVKARFAYRWSE
jgi:hypothetical protein